MEVSAFLANHAEAVNNLLYVSGAGITTINVPPRAPGPYGTVLALGALVSVPWVETNQNHRLRVDLVDADGHAVLVPAGPGESRDFRAELVFDVGRPPTLQPGEAQNVAVAIGMPGLPFPALGTYVFRIFIDDTEMRRLNLRVTAATTMVVAPPAGLSAAP